MIISFFGHSDFCRTTEYEQSLLAFLEETVGQSPAEFYLGDYGGFDRFAYGCCKKYKATHPKTSLMLIIPYLTVEYQKRLPRIQEAQYDGIIYPEIEDKPLRFAIIYRNQWMVEKADYVICGISHGWGGAYKAYQYARRRKKPIINITGKEIP